MNCTEWPVVLSVTGRCHTVGEMAVDFLCGPMRGSKCSVRRRGCAQTRECQQGLIGRAEQQAIALTSAMRSLAAARKTEHIAFAPFDDFAGVTAVSAALHDVVDLARRDASHTDCFARAQLHVARQNRGRSRRVRCAQCAGDVEVDGRSRCARIHRAVTLGKELMHRHRGPGETEAILRAVITRAARRRSVDSLAGGCNLLLDRHVFLDARRGWQ